MDKSAIKSFAIEARKILMKSAVTQAGFYGVSKDGCAQPTQKGAGFEVYRTIAGTDNRIYGDDIKRREKLVKAVEEKGFDQVIEETAYTWFNRLIAIRFMEVNGYLPTRTRVLSSETGSSTPDLMSQYMDVDLDMTMDELEKVQTCVRENRYDDAFALLFVKQCNALNEILPELFEKTTDYMELLLKLSYTSDGVVRMLVDTIPESNFDIEQEGQIEIIGWMYQYYNTELKDETFALLKKNVKITKERIPSATQLFTPDWIVRYMVENSLGRLWVEGHPDEDLKANWKYYLEEAEQEADIQVQLEKIREEYRNLNPEDIKVIDPCMGSGHILVYCFDVLMQIYESEGYTQRDAARLILENNLYGLDIDKRAAQLAYFAVMMKARQYDRRMFSRMVKPHIYVIEESNGINKVHLNYLGKSNISDKGNKFRNNLLSLIDLYKDAKSYGSMLNIEPYDWTALKEFVEDLNDIGQLSIDTIGIDKTQNLLRHLILQGEIMSQKYDVVITNPPYMGSKGMDESLLSYLQKHYPKTKYDLFAVFIQKNLNLLNSRGILGMITQHSWMSGARYEGARELFLNYAILNAVHLGARAFEEIGGEVVQTVSFCFSKCCPTHYKGIYVKLTDIAGEDEKRKAFLAHEGRRYTKSVETFKQMPSYIMGYWVSDRMLYCLRELDTIEKSVFYRQGMATSDNARFLKYWYEVGINRIGFGFHNLEEAAESHLRWFPYNKGGSYRKWYGNNELVVNWENDGAEMKAFTATLPQGTDVRLKSKEYYFKEGFTWSALANSMSVRWCPDGFIFDTKGSMGFPYNDNLVKYYIGLINSNVTELFLKILAPTLDFNLVSMKQIPMIVDRIDEVTALVDKCIDISKKEWDSFETSWDYTRHPLVGEHEMSRKGLLSEKYKKWEAECLVRFLKLKKNEEKINQIFIEMYGLHDELDSTVEEENITVCKANLEREIKSLLSYSVGCMFGRYSLDEQGLIYAGGNWDSIKYITFIPDKDNCIPITDEEYFEDDLVGQFVSWMEKVFGKEHLEENLDFIANALGNKGKTSREVIRNYFLNDFIKDHIKIYQKRPIYWMFDSGKQNGFKCLIYMHRYDKDTVGRVRSDYLRKTQEAIEAALKNAEYTIQNSTSAIDRATATKKRDKYIKQLSEIRTYFQALSHVALQRIDIDLDDGVKVNYEKFQNIEIVDENGKKQKINLLTKI